MHRLCYTASNIFFVIKKSPFLLKYKKGNFLEWGGYCFLPKKLTTFLRLLPTLPKKYVMICRAVYEIFIWNDCNLIKSYPLAVSPDNMTQSEPSRTALATSLASALVGRGFFTIDSNIWVAQIMGTPALN